MSAAATGALFDDLGPKGRRLVRLVTIASSLLVALVLFVSYRRLEANSQLEAPLYEKLVRSDVLSLYAQGAIATLKVAFLAMFLSVIVGAFMALGRLARNRPVRWLSGAYVEIFRAWPLLLVLYFVFLGLPFFGIGVSAFMSLVIALTLYNGAMLAEVFRAGILSLDRGQTEAAASLGLSYRQSMQYIVVPQAGRRMLPAMVSQLIALLKDTSLGIFITFEELLGAARRVGEYEALAVPSNLLQALAAAALVYFTVCFTLSRIARRLELQQQRRFGSSVKVAPGGAEDVTALTNAPDR